MPFRLGGILGAVSEFVSGVGSAIRSAVGSAVDFITGRGGDGGATAPPSPPATVQPVPVPPVDIVPPSLIPWQRLPGQDLADFGRSVPTWVDPDSGDLFDYTISVTFTTPDGLNGDTWNFYISSPTILTADELATEAARMMQDFEGSGSPPFDQVAAADLIFTEATVIDQTTRL